jgi:hypothetical protein
MAHFELVKAEGRLTVEIVGELGEKLAPEQVSAYFQMLAAHNLGEIAESIASLSSRVGDLAEAVERFDRAG